jgi:hypothetical protein
LGELHCDSAGVAPEIEHPKIVETGWEFVGDLFELRPDVRTTRSNHAPAEVNRVVPGSESFYLLHQFGHGALWHRLARSIKRRSLELVTDLPDRRRQDDDGRHPDAASRLIDVVRRRTLDLAESTTSQI